MVSNWKESLIVIDRRSSSWPSGEDALLFNPNNDHTPYIVAHGYDAATGGWASGSYFCDLMDAAVSLRGCIHPDNAILGCSSYDVRELYGDFYGITSEDASLIARNVNGKLTATPETLSDVLEREVVNVCGESPIFARACVQASSALSGMGDHCDSAASFELASEAAGNALRYRTDSDARDEIMAMVSSEDADVSEIAAAVMNYAIIHATMSLDAARKAKPDPGLIAASATAAAVKSSDASLEVSSPKLGV